ncbi:MAG: histidine phosphatase family protein [Acidimicrobiia bacterium]
MSAPDMDNFSVERRRLPGPVDLLLVRHGQSIGNVAVGALAAGEDSGIEVLTEIPQEGWQLTARGREQAIGVGEFINAVFPSGLEFFYSSHFVRACETAAFMNLANSAWRVEAGVGERQIGDRFAGGGDVAALREQVSAEYRQEQANVLGHRPPRGESRRDVRDRVANALNRISANHAGQSGVIVCHGEVMWATRALLERFDDQTWERTHAAAHRSADNAPMNSEMILNGHVFWMSHRHPETGQIHAGQRWLRRVCPEHPTTDTGWYEIPVRDIASRAPETPTALDR